MNHIGKLLVASLFAFSLFAFSPVSSAQPEVVEDTSPVIGIPNYKDWTVAKSLVCDGGNTHAKLYVDDQDLSPWRVVTEIAFSSGEIVFAGVSDENRGTSYYQTSVAVAPVIILAEELLQKVQQKSTAFYNAVMETGESDCKPE